MNKRRTSSGFGLNPIPDEGVEAWARRRRIVLATFEHEALDAIELLYLNNQNKAATK